MNISPLVHFDNVLNFGLHSSPGIFGNIADAMVKILLFHSVDALIKWVNDFIFFQYPVPSSPLKLHFSYDESIIWSVAEELGWPWAPKKFVPFASSFLYISFLWDIENKRVTLPLSKKTKYIKHLKLWICGFQPTLHQTEHIIGTLNHITLVVPEGHAHLPSLYRLFHLFF
jgi:hypothetical protein